MVHYTWMSFLFQEHLPLDYYQEYEQLAYFLLVLLNFQSNSHYLMQTFYVGEMNRGK